MSDWRIPLSDLDYGDEELAAVQRVVESKWLSMGPEVERFEEEFAGFLRSKHAVGTASATAALHLAFVAAGVGPGDEVIQPSINFVAAANMTIAAGARPVFAEILSLDEPTVDPASVERMIGPSTTAVVAMHYGGSLCRLADLRGLCSDIGLVLIEDACHAVGAKYVDPSGGELDGAMAGTIGDLSAFSFFSNKNLATGEGGMVTTNNDEYAERIRRLRSHGMTSLTWDRHRGHASSYDVVANGYNYRIDELHAALGRAQLAKLSVNNQRRRELLTRYHEQLASLENWVLPFSEHPGDTSAHLMVAVAPTAAARSDVLQALRDARIQTSLHYPCITNFAAFAGCRSDALQRSEQFASRAISLPMFPTMTPAQVAEVCSIIRSVAAL